MAAASRFDDVSDEFLGSLLDKSVVFTALLVVVFYPHSIIPLAHMDYDSIAHSTSRENC